MFDSRVDSKQAVRLGAGIAFFSALLIVGNINCSFTVKLCKKMSFTFGD